MVVIDVRHMIFIQTLVHLIGDLVCTLARARQSILKGSPFLLVLLHFHCVFYSYD